MIQENACPRLKILMIFYDLENTAGIQRSISNLSNLFSSYGHSVALSLRSLPPSPSFPITEKIKIFSHSLDEPTAPFPYNIPQKLLLLIRLYAFHVDLLKTHHFDIIIDHGTALGLLFPYGLFRKIPFVLLRHFSVKGLASSGLLYRTMSLFGSKKNIVVLSDISRTNLLELGFLHPHYIPNFPTVNKCVRNHPPISGEYILAVGRPTYQKGFDILISAFIDSKLHKTHDLRLLIVGPSVPQKLSAELSTTISRLETEGIYLRDASNDINTFIAYSKFIVMPSRYEGMPMFAIESLASGKPIIGSDIDGLNTLIKNNYNGLLFPSGQKSSLCAAITKLYLNVDLFAKCQSNSTQSVSQFSPEHILCEWNKYFLQILSLST